MVETLPPLVYGKVVGRFLAAVGDTSADVDEFPDAVPLSGTVTFTPSAAMLLVAAASPVPATVFSAPIVCTLDNAGYLVYSGNKYVYLLATNDPSVNPSGYTYRVSFSLKLQNVPVPIDPYSIAVPSSGVVDLTTVAPVGSSGGTLITQGIQGPVGPQGPAGVANDASVAALIPASSGSATSTQLNAAMSAATVLKWKPSTAYTTGQLVISPGGDVVACVSSFTSGASYSAANWILSPSFLQKSYTQVNVKDYGAKGNGTTDDTTAIQAAITAAQGLVTSVPSVALGTGAVVYFPRGTYLISATLLVTVSNVVIQGESSASAVITAASPTFDMVSFKNDAATIYRSGIRNIRITATGNATAGYALRTERCTYFIATDMHFGGWYGGLIVSGCGVSIFTKLVFSQEERTTGTTGTAILLDTTPSYSSDIHFTDIQVAETLATSVTSAFVVNGVDGLYVENLHLHGEITINPTGAVNLRSIGFTNCYFDGSNGACINLSGSSTGAYDDIRISNCYFRGAVTGLKVSATVAVSNIIVTGCRIHGNSANGIQTLSNSIVTGMIVNGCILSGNNTGALISQGDLAIAGTVNYLTVSDSLFVGGGNPGAAIGIGTGPRNVVLANIDMRQSTAQYRVSYGAGAIPSFKGILGYAVKNKNHVTLTTATTQTVTSGTNLQPTLEAITLTFGGAVPSYYVTNITSSTFDVVFASAPTAGVVMGFQIDMEY